MSTFIYISKNSQKILCRDIIPTVIDQDCQALLLQDICQRWRETINRLKLLSDKQRSIWWSEPSASYHFGFNLSNHLSGNKTRYAVVLKLVWASYDHCLTWSWLNRSILLSIAMHNYRNNQKSWPFSSFPFFCWVFQSEFPVNSFNPDFCSWKLQTPKTTKLGTQHFLTLERIEFFHNQEYS